MIRRRLTLKRVDPWSVLKFGFVVNIAIMLVALLGFWILWIVIGRLGLVEQFCDSVGSIVLDLQECSLNGGNIFRTLLFLGVLGVVVQTGIMVFGAFLYNLIADLTGGLGFSFLDESGDAVSTGARGGTTGSFSSATGERDERGPRTGAAGNASAPSSATAGGAVTRPTSPSGGPPDQSSTPRRPTPDGPPPAPPTPGSGEPRPTPTSAPSGSGRPQPSSSPSAGSAGGGSGPGPSTERSEDTEQPRRGSGPGSSLWGDPGRSGDQR